MTIGSKVVALPDKKPLPSIIPTVYAPRFTETDAVYLQDFESGVVEGAASMQPQKVSETQI